MTDRELLQQALDALQGNWRTDESDKAIEALRARLAQPKPDYEAEFIKHWNEGKVRRVFDGKRMVPEREWVGLTREELAEIAEFHFHGALSGREFYDDVEAKLKEKNT
jgi:hypothetical protein